MYSLGAVWEFLWGASDQFSFFFHFGGLMLIIWCVVVARYRFGGRCVSVLVMWASVHVDTFVLVPSFLLFRHNDNWISLRACPLHQANLRSQCQIHSPFIANTKKVEQRRSLATPRRSWHTAWRRLLETGKERWKTEIPGEGKSSRWRVSRSSELAGKRLQWREGEAMAAGKL
jgi:hypothetical protein